MNELTLKNVKKKYLYGANALNGVSFSLKKNERLTLFGGGGAGKTTLLKAVAGLTDFDGEILLDGVDIRGIPLKKRGISMTFPDAFKPRKSVYENLRFSFEIRGIEGKIFEEKLREIDGIFGIGYLYFFKFKDLNQRQKAVVTAVRCLIREAELYILDNPLKGLPKEEKRDFLLKMLTYLKGRGTLIYATDDLGEARFLNFFNVILDCGYVSGKGFFSELYFKPRELSVCRLLGMNVFADGEEYAVVKPENLEFEPYSLERLSKEKEENDGRGRRDENGLKDDYNGETGAFFCGSVGNAAEDESGLSGDDSGETDAVFCGSVGNAAEDESGLSGDENGETDAVFRGSVGNKTGNEIGRGKKTDGNFKSLCAEAVLIGIESGFMCEVYHFVAEREPREFFCAARSFSPENGGSIPPKIGEKYALFYDETKALRYNKADEKAID
ncbi:MAG: ATP-binding cassette domain-containing protein [Clostridiales bacterium]|jgi:ABC-type sugar transport system ATPase subunit|nr:ATP-binding cassette domain-containing protein [Clostridiales bacterium]